MTPKSLLRHPDARSSFDSMLEGTKFLRMIPESGPAEANAEHVKKLLFCSGKVYYDLDKDRTQKDRVKDVAISRVEQVLNLYSVCMYMLFLHFFLHVFVWCVGVCVVCFVCLVLLLFYYLESLYGM